MKHGYTLAGAALALTLVAGAGCGVSQSEFDALKDVVDRHRDASKTWAEQINVIVQTLSVCETRPNCPYSDPITPPPANGNW
jgi:hypothetical protein